MCIRDRPLPVAVRNIIEQLRQFHRPAKPERPHRVLPVSYTHLDVYKRQGYSRPSFEPEPTTRKPCKMPCICGSFIVEVYRLQICRVREYFSSFKHFWLCGYIGTGSFNT